MESDDHTHHLRRKRLIRADLLDVYPDDFESPYAMPAVNDGGYVLTDEEADADAREDD